MNHPFLRVFIYPVTDIPGRTAVLFTPCQQQLVCVLYVTQVGPSGSIVIG